MYRIESIARRGYVAVLAVFAMLAAMVITALPSQAQASAGDLVDPMKSAAGNALTGGFAVAAILLAGFLIYKAVKRFTSG